MLDPWRVATRCGGLSRLIGERHTGSSPALSRLGRGPGQSPVCFTGPRPAWFDLLPDSPRRPRVRQHSGLVVLDARIPVDFTSWFWGRELNSELSGPHMRDEPGAVANECYYRKGILVECDSDHIESMLSAGRRLAWAVSGPQMSGRSKLQWAYPEGLSRTTRRTCLAWVARSTPATSQHIAVRKKNSCPARRDTSYPALAGSLCVAAKSCLLYQSAEEISGFVVTDGKVFGPSADVRCAHV